MIEEELAIYIAAIRAAFPNTPIYTERVVQDAIKEGFYFEEVSAQSRREQPDTFIDITTYKLYFYPSLDDISIVQARLRDVRRWMEIDLQWLPFVRDFEYTQRQDYLVTTFRLWRHYRLVDDGKPLMGTLTVKP